MSDKQCFHVHLSRKLVGSVAWYQCDNCGQKFLPGKTDVPLVPWDGKVKVTYPEPSHD